MSSSTRTAPCAPPPHCQHPDATRFLDGLRGLAALYVLIYHALRISGTGDAATPRDWFGLNALLMRFFGHGHAAVIFFFVLSGFVIHLSKARILADTPNARFNFSGFLARRVRRLYPPLLAAIALTWIVDTLGVRLGFTSFYAAAGESFRVFRDGMAVNHHWTTLLGNLGFVAQMYTPIWGTNGALWSLSYEWWFYMLYPLLWFTSRRSIRLTTALVLGAFLITALPAGWPPIESGTRPFHGAGIFVLPRRLLAALPAWYAGMLLADAYAGRTRIPLKRFIFLTPLLLVGFKSYWPDALRTACLGAGFAGLLAAAFCWQRAGRSLRPLERLGLLGDFSYTLYATHLPLVVFLFPLWALYGNPHLPKITLVVLIGLPLVVAYVIHFLIERPFAPARPRVNVQTRPAPAMVAATA